jgi:ACS family tartrate transporter-like MFS transporter
VIGTDELAKRSKLSSQEELAAPIAEDIDETLERDTVQRVTWRIVPLVALGYFITYLDRVNISFAALRMNKDIGIDPAQFGLAAGIFYISYCLLEVPSNMALERFGGRRWLSRITISCGLIGVCTAFVTGPHSFYLMRILLGAAEAGFYPGVIYYMTLWFPTKYRARMIAMFGLSLPVAVFIGSPISAWLVDVNNYLGLKGWQWLFFLESIPAIVLGILFLILLVDDPCRAKWLTPPQRQWLVAELAGEKKRAESHDKTSVWQVLANRNVLYLALVYSGTAGATVGLGIWLPQILHSFGLSNRETGLLNMLPFGVAAICMLWWGKLSDRTGERIWRTALPLLLACGSLLALPVIHSLLLTTLLLSGALIGTYAMKGPFWALVSEVLPTSWGATAIGQINALSNLTGFGATYLLGVLKNATGSYPISLLPIAILLGLSTIPLLTVDLRASKSNQSG